MRSFIILHDSRFIFVDPGCVFVYSTEELSGSGMASYQLQQEILSSIHVTIHHHHWTCSCFTPSRAESTNGLTWSSILRVLKAADCWHGCIVTSYPWSATHHQGRVETHLPDMVTLLALLFVFVWLQNSWHTQQKLWNWNLKSEI